MDLPIVFSFDVVKPDTQFLIGINGYYTLEIKPNDNKQIITEITNKNLDKFKLEDNTFLGTKIIIEEDESQSGYMFNDELIKERPILKDKNETPDQTTTEDDKFLVFDNDDESLSLNDFENGGEIFFLTENPKTDNIILSELGTFEKVNQDAYEIVPLVFDVDDESPLLVELDANSLSFLLLGYEVTKNFSKDPTTTFTTTTFTYSKTEYQTTDDLLKNQYRFRCVISNNGRIISLSTYDSTNLKQWKIFKTIIVDIPKIIGEQTVLFSIANDNDIKNITANF